jgi:hypothetical protein
VQRERRWRPVSNDRYTGWQCDDTVITAEVVDRYPQETVQRFAMEAAGIELPDEAFPPPEPEYPTTVAGMEALILDLLSRPREDL